MQSHIKCDCNTTKEFTYVVILALNHQSLQHNIIISIPHCVCVLYQKHVMLLCSVASKVLSSVPLIIHALSALIILPMTDDNMQ